MKIRLLNAGGFEGLENVVFPAEVEAKLSEDGLYVVAFNDAMSLPGAFWCDGDTEKWSKYSFFDNEVEVVK